MVKPRLFIFFFFNDTATTEIYTLSLHDALPIWSGRSSCPRRGRRRPPPRAGDPDRKSTRLNSSHDQISYAVFCLKKQKKNSKYKSRYVSHHLTRDRHEASLEI